MRPTTFIALIAALPSLLHAAPTDSSAKLQWRLTDYSTYYPSASNPGASSYVRFTFHDQRPGLELTTTCTSSLFPGDGRYPTLRTPKVGGTCTNSSVTFTHKTVDNTGKIELFRLYEDPSVGPPGMDMVRAYGYANATVPTTTTDCGTYATVGSVPAMITALVA